MKLVPVGLIASSSESDWLVSLGHCLQIKFLGMQYVPCAYALLFFIYLLFIHSFSFICLPSQPGLRNLIYMFVYNSSCANLLLMHVMGQLYECVKGTPGTWKALMLPGARE